MAPDSDGALFQQLDEAYRTYAPTIAQRKPFSVQVQEREHEILQSGYFKNKAIANSEKFKPYLLGQVLDTEVCQLHQALEWHHPALCSLYM
jgi:hypothetical protein